MMSNVWISYAIKKDGDKTPPDFNGLVNGWRLSRNGDTNDERCLNTPGFQVVAHVFSGPSSSMQEFIRLASRILLDMNAYDIYVEREP